MYCHFCGKENADDHAFCIYCGTTLEPLDMPIKKKKRTPPPPPVETVPEADEEFEEEEAEPVVVVPRPRPAAKPALAPAARPQSKSGSTKKKKKKSKVPMALVVFTAVLLIIMIIELIVLLVIPNRPTHGANINSGNQAGSNAPAVIIDDTNTNQAAVLSPAPTAAPGGNTAPAVTPAPAPVPTAAPVATPAPTAAPAARTPVINTQALVLPENHKQGSSFSLGGKITCDIGTITNVSAVVYDAGRNAVMNASDNPNRAEYNLFNSAIDYSMTFGKLASGSYTMEITVTAKNGDAEIISTVVSRSFTVQAAGSTDNNGITIIG